jgi:hypothetical protein
MVQLHPQRHHSLDQRHCTRRFHLQALPPVSVPAPAEGGARSDHRAASGRE